MDTTKCISNRDWEAYSRGELGSAQIAVLQAHCASCEICADIKEGIDAMVNPSLLSQKVDIINKEIAEKVNPKKNKIIPIYYWLAAAAVFFAVSLFVLNLDKKVDSVQQELVNKTIEKQDSFNNENAVEEPKKELAIQSEPKPKKQVVKVFRPEPIIVSEESLGGEEQEVILEKDNVKADDVGLLIKGVVSNENKEEVLVPVQTNGVIEQKKLTESSSSIDLSSVHTTTGAKVTRKVAKYKAIYPSNFANNQNAQLNNFSNSNTNSIRNFEVDTLPISNAKEMYFQTKYDSALQVIQPILQNPVSKWHEEALWLKSQILQAQKDLVQTEIVLNQLIALKGKYQGAAELQLKALKK